MLKLGNIYSTGFEDEKIYREEYLKIAKKYGWYKAYPVQIDYAKALDWFIQLKDLYGSMTENKSSAAQSIAYMQKKGLGVTADKRAAKETLKKADLEIEAHNLFVDGGRYHNKKDYAKAFSTFMKCAEMGNKNCMRNVGTYYYEGWSVQKDINQAFTWWKKAADAGEYYTAAHALADMYHNGMATEKNDVEAARYMLLSAEAGNPNAMYWMGYYYREGIGVNKDPQKAIGMLEKALNKSNGNIDKAGVYNQIAYAYFSLGKLDTAIQTLQKALEVNPRYANACDSMGEMYDNSGNKEKAIECYQKAAAMGYKNSIEWLKKNGIN